MNYWLIKSEPKAYSWEELKKDKKTAWTGVRNYAARLNLRAMKKGDLAFFYHSNEGTEVVGIARICREQYPDPTAKSGDWCAVDVEFFKQFKTPVTLARMKSEPSLAAMDLIRISRLSVGKVSAAEFARVCAMGGVTV